MICLCSLFQVGLFTFDMQLFSKANIAKTWLEIASRFTLMKRVVIGVVLLGISQSLLAASTYLHLELMSRTLQRIWNCSIYLPDNYGLTGQKYPVIYLLHGRGDDEYGWQPGIVVLDSLMAAGRIPPVIAVAPSGHSSWWVNTLEPLETALISELIPYIDANYSTIGDRSGRAVAGYSMGGFGALRYALVYPELFGAAIILSPALYDGDPPLDSSARSTGAFGTPFNLALWKQLNYPSVLEQYLQSKWIVPLFIAAGDDEGHNPFDLHNNVEQQVVLLYEKVHKADSKPAELRILNGGHSWNVWKKAFTEGLPYIFQFLSGDGDRVPQDHGEY
jgi:enterochelin esterase-like enzyme